MRSGDGLVAWLTKILDEDQAMAQAAIDDDGGQDGGFEDEFDRLTKGRDHAGPLAFEPRFAEACARMIVWNTPRRVLADIAAKRAIVERYERFHENLREHPDDLASKGALLALLGAVKDLASAYADRPGYDEEWQPDSTALR